MTFKNLRTLTQYADTKRLPGWVPTPLVRPMNQSEYLALLDLLVEQRPNLYWLLTRWPEGAEL